MAETSSPQSGYWNRVDQMSGYRKMKGSHSFINSYDIICQPTKQDYIETRWSQCFIYLFIWKQGWSEENKLLITIKGSECRTKTFLDYFGPDREIFF